MRPLLKKPVGFLAISLVASACATVGAPPSEAPGLSSSPLPVVDLPREPETSEPVEGPAEDREAPKNAFMLFLGATHREATHFGASLSYERVIVPVLGVGLEVETSPADRETVLLIPSFTIHPGGGFYFVLAPGFELEETETLSLLRTGVGYEIELEGGWIVAAEMNHDFVEHADDAVVVGLVLGYRF